MGMVTAANRLGEGKHSACNVFPIDRRRRSARRVYNW